MKNRNGSAALVLIVVFALAVIGGIAYMHYIYLPQLANQNDANIAASSTPSAAGSSTQVVATGNGPSTNTPAKATTITLNAATKVAVVQAIMNGIDILSSNDAAKIRSYFLVELQNSSQATQFKAMSDSQLLQLAADAVVNTGKPTADLATDPTAVWKVSGNTVTVAHKTYAKPNPTYPAIADLTVTYQAVYVNGAWE